MAPPRPKLPADYLKEFDVPADPDLQRHPLTCAFERSNNWSEEIEVDESKLKDYLRAKRHGLIMRSARVELAYTLTRTPPTICHDGKLHVGDTFLLHHHFADGPEALQADIKDERKARCPTLASGTIESCRPVSVGKIMYPCLRNTFSVTNAGDAGFGDITVRFGAPLRMHVNLDLSSRPMYLHADREQASAPRGLRVLLFPRASRNTVWRLWPADHAIRDQLAGHPVPVGTPLDMVLEHNETKELLGTDEEVVENNYGNEQRVYAMDHFKEHLDAPEVKEGIISVYPYACSRGRGKRNLWRIRMDDCSRDDFWDPPQPPVHEPQPHCPGPVEDDELNIPRNLQVYQVLDKIHPMLKQLGMHGIRTFRRMCTNMDFLHDGTVPARAFEGVLSWVGIKLDTDLREFEKLVEIFEEPKGSEMIDYAKFLKLIRPRLSPQRLQVMTDAFAALTKRSNCGFIEVQDLQKWVDPHFHPDVQQKRRSEVEILEEFLSEWDVTRADGVVVWDDFLDYYSDVSLSVDDDLLFVEMVRRTWRL